MGQSYRLSCPEGGETRLLQAVERVNTAMCKIRDGGKVRARDRIAVLAALNLAFDIADNVSATPATNALVAPIAEPKPKNLLPEKAVLDKTESHTQLQALLQKLDSALQSDVKSLTPSA